jgi:hypothetical protein
LLCAIAVSILAGNVTRTQTVVGDLIAKAQAEIARGERETASSTLHLARAEAVLTLESAERDEAITRVDQIAKRNDSRFRERIAMEKAAAERFSAVARGYLERGLPRTAEVALAYGQRYSATEVLEAMAEAEGSVSGGPQDEGFATYYRDFSEASSWRRMVDGQIHEDEWFDEFWKARNESAAAALELASRYERAKWYEVAYDLALLARVTANGSYFARINEVQANLIEHRSAKRFEAIAKPHMEHFRRNNRKFGRSRQWRVSTRGINGPVPEDYPTFVVSKTLVGDSRIEADFAFHGMIGQAYLIFAFVDKDNYCALEYDRPGSSIGHLRLLHFKDGEKITLSRSLAPQLLGGWHRFSVEVTGRRVTGSYHALRPQPELLFEKQLATPQGPLRMFDVQVSAEIPYDVSAGWAYGFRQDPYPGNSKNRETRLRRQLRYRNLVITTLR